MPPTPSAVAPRQFFLADTLRWEPAQGLPDVREIGLAKRSPEGAEEIVGYDKIVEGQNYIYAQRKCRVTKAFPNGTLGITFELKEDYWYRNCVPAGSLKPIPEKKPKKPVAKPAPAAKPAAAAAPAAPAEPPAAPSTDAPAASAPASPTTDPPTTG